MNKIIEDLRPDVVVNDFFFYPGVKAAERLGIPVVINVQAPLVQYVDMGLLHVPDMANATNCGCGIICLRESMKNCCVRVAFTSMSKDLMPYFSTWSEKRTLLFNSFWGLERPICLPPNVQLIGPLSHPQERLVEDLRAKDQELYDWLEEALAQNVPVAYVNMGSVSHLQPWSLKAITDGLKKLNCRVVWALREEYRKLAPEDPSQLPNFWVRPWILQIETIAHPAIKVGMTHMGSGATQEFIGAGVPVVAFPHFGDQHYYGDLLQDMKAGVVLYGKRRDYDEGPDQMVYRTPAFDGDRVHKCFEQVIENPMYKTNMLKLQRLSQRLDGRRKLVQAVLTAYEDGNDHLIDKHMSRHFNKLNCCLESVCTLLLIGLIAAFVYFLLFFIENYDLV